MFKSLFLLSCVVGAVQAFFISPAALCSTSTRLYAEGGAPQYEKGKATVSKVEQLADASVMLHIDTKDKIDYEPGHVLALEIQGQPQDEDSHTYEDTKANGGWMRGPYTVSRATENSLDILLQVVGEKSKTFATAPLGTPLRFGGKFKVPILEGVDVDTTCKVVFISTGVGVGPCIGAIEKALSEETNSEFPPIQLLASYRTPIDIVLKEHLDELQDHHSEKFAWTPIISNQQGRLSSSEENLQLLAKSAAGVTDTHFHLIGNGQMVKEFQAGLKKAGVPDEKVTVEIYFNHKAEADADTVDRIAKVVKEVAAVYASS
jgi:ferredoxin-NADP reductase